MDTPRLPSLGGSVYTLLIEHLVALGNVGDVVRLSLVRVLAAGVLAWRARRPCVCCHHKRKMHAD
jgi:hypothetical protein